MKSCPVGAKMFPADKQDRQT